jgi:hypothetical protein
MTVASKTNHDDENHRHDKGPKPDDMSDVTPPTRGNVGNFDHGTIRESDQIQVRSRSARKTAGRPKLDPHSLDACSSGSFRNRRRDNQQQKPKD